MIRPDDTDDGLAFGTRALNRPYTGTTVLITGRIFYGKPVPVSYFFIQELIRYGYGSYTVRIRFRYDLVPEAYPKSHRELQNSI
jgi:hypothetical protein